MRKQMGEFVTKFILTAALWLCLSLSAMAQGSRYCNPLPMPIGPGGNASGDVTSSLFKSRP